MKNIKIEKTTNNTYVVKADTERFGKQRIIFESYKINDCINYLKSFEKFGFRITESVYQQVAEILLENMPENKKELLSSAINRNDSFTSFRGLENINLYITENGTLLKMRGVRCGFVLFMDNYSAYRRTPNHEAKGIKPILLYDMGNENYFDKFFVR